MYRYTDTPIYIYTYELVDMQIDFYINPNIHVVGVNIFLCDVVI